MRYILSVLLVAPIVLIISIIIEIIIHKILKKSSNKKGKTEKVESAEKNEKAEEIENTGKIERKRIVAETLLICWGLMFIYVTQIMSFGNGLGDRINLRPLRLFFTAFRYGSNNANGVWQFFLNIVMFVPLGFLLPTVFEKCRNWHNVLIISFICTVATELIQLITRRGTDIDDVIANTLGGLCGFALYLIIAGLISLIKRTEIKIARYKVKLLMGILLIVLVGGVFGGLRLCDGTSKYGSLYYGHLKPTEVEVPVTLDERQSERPVYKYSERISLGELENKLKSITGFAGEWKEENNTGGTYYSLFGDDTHVVFIEPYNTWSVLYEYGVDSESAADNAIDENAALDKAWEYLDLFDISSSDVVYDAAIIYDFNDEYYHFYFSPIESGEDTKIYGTVNVNVGQDGRLIEISDDRIWCEFVEYADCISQAESIKITTEVGCGNWQEKAVVNNVEESFAFIPETGYLIPTWKITGYLNADNGQKLDWEPEIDAVK